MGKAKTKPAREPSILEQIQAGKVEDRLEGMKSICDHMRRSDATVLKLVRTRAFPAAKIGGVWESDKSLIDEWRVRMIREEAEKNAAEAV